MTAAGEAHKINKGVFVRLTNATMLMISGTVNFLWDPQSQVGS